MEGFWIGEHPIVSTDLNLSFTAVLGMDDLTFAKWAEASRLALGRAWLEDAIPPHTGTTFEEIEGDMRDISLHDTSNFLEVDSVTGRSDVIAADGRHGSFLKCLFTNMGKAADGNGSGGVSIHDYLTADEQSEQGRRLAKQWRRILARIVRGDSMYQFSRSLKPESEIALGAANGVRWVQQPFNAGLNDHWAAYWIEKSDKTRDDSELNLSRNDVYMLARFDRIRPEHVGQDRSLDRIAFANALLGAKPDGPVFPWVQKGHFRIRTMERDQQIFPRLLSMLRTGLVVQGTNFPALIAKYLIQKYTRHLVNSGKEIVVYDPSAGYGGRCLGALAAATDNPIRYIGTDPNSEHWITSGRSRYDIIADYYRATVGQKFHATVKAFCCGSEDIHQNPAFQQYRGEIDLIFTSPPYFCAEIYSREATQSAIKFRTYDAWRDGFLRPTLKTCVEFLKPGGFLLWNIADVQIDGRYVPLEADSISCLTELGMVMKEKLKMPLATVTGGGKMKDGLPTTKNFVMLRGNYRKYEPIFVFHKPL
jgi:DNA methylase